MLGQALIQGNNGQKKRPGHVAGALLVVDNVCFWMAGALLVVDNVCFWTPPAAKDGSRYASLRALRMAIAERLWPLGTPCFAFS